MPKTPSHRKTTASVGWTVSVIGASFASELDAARPNLPRGSFAVADTQADSKGNVIFADTEEVKQSHFEIGLSNCMALASSIVNNATLPGLNLELDGITLKLSVNAKYGCSFIADARFAGGIEVKLKKKHAPK